MTPATAFATIHQLDPTHRRAAAPAQTGDTREMTTVGEGKLEGKLDKVLEQITAVRVDQARVSERIEGIVVQSNARDRDIEALRQRVQALESRPSGMTGKVMLAYLASVAGTAAALVAVVDKVHIG